MSQSVSGRLRVGAVTSIAPYLLPQAIRGFLQRYPAVEVTVREDMTHPLVAAVVAGEVDVALMTLPVEDERLHAEELLTEPLLLTMARDHRLTKRRRITVEDIAGERFIILNDMKCLGEQVVSFCHQHAFQPHIACLSSQMLTIQMLVAMGQGVTLLPEMAREADRSAQRVYRSLSGDDKPSRTVVAVCHRHRYRSAATEQFLARLRDRHRLVSEGVRPSA